MHYFLLVYYSRFPGKMDIWLWKNKWCSRCFTNKKVCIYNQKASCKYQQKCKWDVQSLAGIGPPVEQIVQVITENISFVKQWFPRVRYSQYICIVWQSFCVINNSHLQSVLRYVKITKIFEISIKILTFIGLETC